MSRTSVPPPVTLVMEAADAWLPAQMAKVEEHLRELAGGHGPALGEDARATLEAGGKRLRPMLVLLCAGPGAETAAVRSAVAVELVHMATLVHDDVLDSAPLRRGRPTVVATSGPERATAVGDLLFSRAFAELSEVEGGERRVGLLSAAAVSLARGELVQRRDAFDLSITRERYLERCRLKTARLFECACLIGRDDRAADEPLAEYGREVGLAFQLLDDILDVTGPPQRTGKARGTDLLDGTVTLPLILARQRDPEVAEADLASLDSTAAERLCDRIVATGVLDEARQAALERIASAKAALETAPLDAQQQRLLELVADGVVERYS